MASYFRLSVPRELAICTNHPNIASISIDSTLHGPYGRQTRSQTKPASSATTDRNTDDHAISNKSGDFSNQVKLTVQNESKRSHNLVGLHARSGAVDPNHESFQPPRPRKRMRSSPVDSSKEAAMESPPKLSDCTTPESQASTSTLSSFVPSPPCASPDEYLSHFRPSTKLRPPRKNGVSPSLVAPNSRSKAFPLEVNLNNDKASSTKSRDKQSTSNKARTFSDSTIRGDPRIVSTRIAARHAAASKSAERIALETHLRLHDSYGVVRFFPGDCDMPVNSESHSEVVEGIIRNEPLMRRIEVIHEKQKRRRGSEKKLWDLGKQSPWVLDRFETYAEYETWIKSEERRRARWAQSQRITRLQEQLHTGETTEEEVGIGDTQKEYDSAELEVNDAACILIELSCLDKRN